MLREEVTKGLKRAEENIFCFTNFDLSYDLGRENMKIGVFKMMEFFKAMGADPNNVLVVFGPDGAITRNTVRFQNGVSDGCVISTKEYAFPTFYRPNTCGFGVYKIPNFEESQLESIVKNQEKLVQEGITLESEIEISDTHKSNHFIDIFKVEKIRDDGIDLEKGDYVTIVHCNSQTHKQELYEYPQGSKIIVDTPLGKIEGLKGQQLDEYMKFFRKIEKMSLEKRDFIAKALFGDDVRTIVNKTHQGIFKENGRHNMRLDAQNSLDENGKPDICPLAFNSYNPIFLFKGRQNIRRGFWTKNQEERAKKIGHEETLEHINILPHGGGYKLPLPFIEARIKLLNRGVFFELKSPAHRAPYTIRSTSVRSLEFAYRSPSQILSATKRFEMGEEIAVLSPVYIMKI